MMDTDLLIGRTANFNKKNNIGFVARQYRGCTRFTLFKFNL